MYSKHTHIISETANRVKALDMDEILNIRLLRGSKESCSLDDRSTFC